MAGSGRVTLNDVAAASGVSRATVSFVLNDDPNQTISPATQERVRQAARDLGYVPHGIARALREGSSRIVVLDIDWGLEGNYSRSYIRGLDDELAAHDHVLLVRHGHGAPHSTQQVLDTITPRAVLRFPEAYLSGHEPDAEDWKNGFAGHAALQIRYLAERGHTNIAMALPDSDSPLTEVRLRFVHETADVLGLPAITPFVVPRPRAAGTVAVEAFRAAHESVTAVAAFDDDVALRTLTALHDLGLTVPDDIAVVGFDDTEYGALITPALTTVHIDAEAHGRLAARAALGLDTGGITRSPGRVLVRDSA
ncbi:DNA-binding transcriptional regulator, LacI/PurR family [Streptomyces sp. OV198]|uniref:LacI family DNA-binding transcriptional regulator n=1 Tax=Streptomyces sp. OV198 TaxID=1882787 RepID=UPI000BC745E8|nr:LacI family DNA-binding transcriptional regulator [Streptomyces sp. OV198]SOE79076.1 DNA-binding transcriptional regulator, LacI/PurR family [Streptomyces sp. OV198]